MPLNSRPRVLCVDDDADSRLLLIALLKTEKIGATVVCNATQALDQMQAERFDLLLLDAWLPGMDGFELCERVRTMDQSTPIMFYSGAAYEADRDRAILAGATAYVVKPDIDRMLKTVKQLVTPPLGRTVKTCDPLMRDYAQALAA